jgi:hypothetical protein
VSGNIGFNNNKIISLGLINEITSAATYSNWASTEIGQDFRVVTGGSVGEMFGYVSDGRYEDITFNKQFLIYYFKIRQFRLTHGN